MGMFSIFLSTLRRCPFLRRLTLLVALGSREVLRQQAQILSQCQAVFSAHLNCQLSNLYFQQFCEMMRVSARRLFGTRRPLASKQVEFLSDPILLKRTIASDYFFVRKNYKQIGHEIETLVKTHQWSTLRKALNLISIAELDSWLTLRKVALALQQTLNQRLEFASLSEGDIQDMLAVLVLLRYEPVPKHTQQYVYDDMAAFTAALQKYIDSLDEINEHYFQVIRYTIHTNPQLFLNNRDNIEHFITTNIDSMLKRGYYFTEVLSRGLISGFWTPRLKQMLMAKVSAQNRSKLAPLLFQSADVATEIELQGVRGRIKTEADISNILEGYNYDIQPNVRINSYEVDVLVGGTVVVEYNGHHHYAINAEKMVVTVKEAWKHGILRRRGFVVVSIPYWEWKFLKLFEQKRDYLVHKLEHAVIEHFR